MSEVSPNLPKCVRDRLAELDPEALDQLYMIDGMEGAMIGVTENAAGNTVGVYERNHCIRILARGYMRDDPNMAWDDAYEAAVDWLEFNVLGSLPNLGDRAPIIIEGFECDWKAWESFETED